MKTKSTYSLLVNSEEKGRSLFEAAIYSLVVLCTVVSVGQFAMQDVTVPGQVSAKTTSSVMVADAKTKAPVTVRG